jgi:hypothetical protein
VHLEAVAASALSSLSVVMVRVLIEGCLMVSTAAAAAEGPSGTGGETGARKMCQERCVRVFLEGHLPRRGGKENIDQPLTSLQMFNILCSETP